ncbi:MAG: hypothetical protein HN348_02455 [Proteobacteria bacterium]|jgi:tetratricopeptide (TPR) repeat protein|nr:hypothetical protein [Pseudomonadota bacterium]
MAVFCWLLFLVSALAQEPLSDAVQLDRGEPEELFLRANQAYEADDHDLAIRLYEQLIAQDVVSGPIYYNMGNSHLRSGSLGQAIAAYRQARFLSPRDEDVRANMDFARKSAKDAIVPQQASPLLRTAFFWHFLLSRHELAQALAVFNLLFFAALVWRRFRRESEIARWCVACSGLPLLALAISLTVKTFLPVDVAVVGSPEMKVYSGMAKDTVVRFALHEGTEAKLIEVSGYWALISLSDGKRGWVQRGDIIELRLK